MVQLHSTATCFITVSRQKSWGSGQDRNYNPYKPNLLRSKSLGPAHSQKERITQGYETQEKGVIGNHFRGFLPRLFVTAASLPYYIKSDGAVCIAGVAEHFEHFCMNILPILPAYSWE